MRGTAINSVTNWMICSFPKPNIFLSLNNNTSDLIEERQKEHVIKLSRISFHPFYIARMEIFDNKVICHQFVTPDHYTVL